jgi:hypothetical protein
VRGLFSPWIQDCADSFISLVDLEERNVFEIYQMPQQFKTFGAVPIGKNALFDAMSKAAEQDPRPKEAARAAYAEVGGKTLAAGIEGMQLSDLAIQGLKIYIRDLLDNKSIQFSFRAVVDQIMAFHQPEVRQRVKTAVTIAMENIIAEGLEADGLWELMTKHHFVLLIIVSRGQPASFETLKKLAEEIAIMPGVLVKAIARFVAKPKSETECGELRSWVTRYKAMRYKAMMI